MRKVKTMSAILCAKNAVWGGVVVAYLQDTTVLVTGYQIEPHAFMSS